MGMFKMASAKDIILKPINSKDARRLTKLWHYSGKVVNNSNIHFGVFLEDKCLGVMQFGSPMVKKNVITLVEGTGWNDFLELNRMAFSDKLPRNSESRAIAVAMKLIKKHYPHIKWVLSFSDATQCGDGTIYRASGFVLTQIKKNTGMLRLKDGSVVSNMTVGKGKHILLTGGKSKNPEGSVPLEGYQLRYIYFIDKSYREKLTCDEIPFSEIKKRGIGMYRGKLIKHSSDAVDDQLAEGGVIPTNELQPNTKNSECRN